MLPSRLATFSTRANSVSTTNRRRSATYSLAEGSRKPDSDRIRNFTSDHIVAFATTFGLPIAWFFLPPDPTDTEYSQLGLDYWIGAHDSDVDEPAEHGPRPYDLILLATLMDRPELKQRLAVLLQP